VLEAHNKHFKELTPATLEATFYPVNVATVLQTTVAGVEPEETALTGISESYHHNVKIWRGKGRVLSL
jgi:hypothetical protein